MGFYICKGVCDAERGSDIMITREGKEKILICIPNTPQNEKEGKNFKILLTNGELRKEQLQEDLFLKGFLMTKNSAEFEFCQYMIDDGTMFALLYANPKMEKGEVYIPEDFKQNIIILKKIHYWYCNAATEEVAEYANISNMYLIKIKGLKEQEKIPFYLGGENTETLSRCLVCKKKAVGYQMGEVKWKREVLKRIFSPKLIPLSDID